MAWTWKTDGTDELSQILSQLSDKAGYVGAYALYDGAGVMADAVTKATNSIQTEEFHYAAVEGMTTRLPSPEEKALLTNGAAGIATFRKNGSVISTSVGFDKAGYGTVNGKTKPIPQIANAINSGTSFMRKQPFFRKAVNGAKAAAQAAMDAKGNELIEEITNK